MKMKLFFIIAVCAVSAENVEDPIVCIENGCVRGKSFKGNQKEFEGFLGIPYAEPPVDDLRLRVSFAEL